MYARPCPCRATPARLGSWDLAFDLPVGDAGEDYPATGGGGGGGGIPDAGGSGGGGAFTFPGEDFVIPPPTDMDAGQIAPPMDPDAPEFTPTLFVECVPGFTWNGSECVPDPAPDPGTTEGGGSYSPGGYTPPPTTTTDPAGGGQVPAGGAFHPDAAGPEVASPGAGEEMLGWILGAIISAALVSRER